MTKYPPALLALVLVLAGVAAGCRTPPLGSAVDDFALTNDASYPGGLARYEIVVPENASKWSEIHPERDRYDFSAFDRVVDFAQAHGQEVWGLPLVWYQQVPQWLTTGTFTRDEMITILQDHIRTVMGRYRGRVTNWIVVNEDVQEDGTLRTGGFGGGTAFDGGLWRNGIGDDYVDIAFRTAREADPDAKLWYNDYGAETATPYALKYNGVRALVSGLVARGVPIDGVGLQMHTYAFPASTSACAYFGCPGGFARQDPNAVRLTMRDYAALGLKVAITEMDVRLKLPATKADLQNQAVVYRDIYQVCSTEPNCTAFNTWDYTDKYSWIPNWSPGFGAALPFDEWFRPKPAAGVLGLASQVVPGVGSVTEGTGGTTTLEIPVTLSTPSKRTVTVAWQTLPSSAISPDDFDAASGTMTFEPGQTTATVAVTVQGDALQEGTERFLVRFDPPMGAALGGYGFGAGDIIDDDQG
jgi:endo-1,4-beta-xylanase